MTRYESYCIRSTRDIYYLIRLVHSKIGHHHRWKPLIGTLFFFCEKQIGIFNQIAKTTGSNISRFRAYSIKD